jgi:inorganic pyrophosphatase
MSEKTIVVVDDEPSIVDMLTTFLEIKGYTVHGAYSGEEGLTLVQTEKPDALLLDLMLPDIDGFDVMQRLRGMPDFARLPIIVVTARADIGAKARAEKLGSSDYLTKPVQMPELMTSLTRLLTTAPVIPAPSSVPVPPPSTIPMPPPPQSYWDYLDRLVTASRIVIDRPKGSAHPRYPQVIYPVNYGYLEGTTASDRGGIDIWVGSTGARQPNAIICTLDLLKRDAEIKILLGCSEEEVQAIMKLLNEDSDSMRGLLVRRG